MKHILFVLLSLFIISNNQVFSDICYLSNVSMINISYYEWSSHLKSVILSDNSKEGLNVGGPNINQFTRYVHESTPVDPENDRNPNTFAMKLTSEDLKKTCYPTGKSVTLNTKNRAGRISPKNYSIDAILINGEFLFDAKERSGQYGKLDAHKVCSYALVPKNKLLLCYVNSL